MRRSTSDTTCAIIVAMRNWKNEDKIALWVLLGISALGAVERFYRHPTFGTGLKAATAALTFAVSG